MKKILMLAAAAATIFTSCIMEDGVGSGSGKDREPNTTLTVKIAGVTTATRAAIDAAGVDGSKNSLTNAVIFVLNGNNVYAAQSYNATEVTAALVAGTGGGYKFTFSKEIRNDAGVYIVANIPAGASTTVDQELAAIKKLRNIAAIKAYTADIEAWDESDADHDYLKSTVANKNGAIVKVNDSDPTVAVITPGSGNTKGDAQVNITLSPVISRLELVQVKSESVIEGFDVTGVYLFDYKPYYTFGAGASGSLVTIASTAHDDIKAELASVNPTGITTTVSATNTIGTTYVAKPANTGDVWAFNVAAGTLPMLIVELTNLTSEYDDPSGSPAIAATEKRYLKITGYKDLTAGTELDASGNFLPGKIYSVNSINFAAKHIDMANPGVVGTVDTDVVDWGEIGGKPTLDANQVGVTLDPAINSSQAAVEIYINGQLVPSFPAKGLTPGWEVRLVVTPQTGYDLTKWTVSGGLSLTDLGLTDDEDNIYYELNFIVPDEIGDSVVITPTMVGI